MSTRSCHHHHHHACAAFFPLVVAYQQAIGHHEVEHFVNGLPTPGQHLIQLLGLSGQQEAAAAILIRGGDTRCKNGRKK